MHCLATLLSLFLLVHHRFRTHAFTPPKGQSRRTDPMCVVTNGRFFLARLYDDPLPPGRSPPPLDTPKSNAPEDIDDEMYIATDYDEDDDDSDRTRLFQFHSNGTEVNGLLPNLGRSLASNIPCYFEPSDRKVVNLVDKTLCHVEDACWALEACKGDITEAWTSISVARRMQYSTTMMTEQQDPSIASSGAVDRDLYELEIEEEFEERKEQRRLVQRLQDRDEFFTGGERDQNVWPKFRPGPDESEPWFTG